MFGSNYESIMEVFTKTVAKLNNRADTLQSAVTNRNDEITRLKQQNFSDQHEQALCINAAGKIGELL